MTVDIVRHQAVAVVTINRPEARNALDPQTSAALGKALREAADDPEVGAVVLTGAGDRAFCAGMDLKAFAALGPQAAPVDGAGMLMRDRYGKPIVAAVNGPAVAGGFDLMLACDLVVAADHATFGLPEVKRGVASVGGTTRLTQRVPLAVALEIGLTGAVFDAHRALALGLVNRVVPADRVVAEALDLALAIAANAPLAVAFTRRLMHDVAGSYGKAQWEQTQGAAAGVFGSADAREGARAFAEKRPPRWTGT
jgi:enoyl-CoA hydratase